MSEHKHSGTMTYVVGDRGPESVTYYGGAMVLGRMGGTVSCTVDHGGAPCPGYPPIYDLRQGQSPYPPLNWDGTPKDTLPEDADATLPAPEEKPYDPAGDGCECGPTRAVDFGDPEVNALWDEAVAGHIEGTAATVLIRSVMPKMAALVARR